MQVRPRTAEAAGRRPPMAGRMAVDGDDVCFVPRFSFMDGTAYTVSVGGSRWPFSSDRPPTSAPRPRFSLCTRRSGTCRATSCASMWCSQGR